MHVLLRVVLVVVAAVQLPGCSFLGIGCNLSGDTPFCSQYAGTCCDKNDGKGFILCGSLDQSFQYPCGRGPHSTTCECVEKPTPFPSFSQTPSSPFATFGLPPFTYDLVLPYAGMSTAHHLVFTATVDDLQTFAGAVTYSADFGFNGFTALGPPGTTIGSYQLDFGADGEHPFAVPLRALGADTAYVDINLDGQATAVDPTITHLANVPSPGSRTFQLALPAGGDMAPLFARIFRVVQIHAVLNAGILTNPATPGSYPITGTFTSVDPDTGDASNGTGQSPLTLSVPATGIAIATSPLELLDHFLCYKTKPSKGLLCNGTATVNAGGLCATDAECGGVAGACAANKWPKGVQRALGDAQSAFTARTADVTKPVRLCTPAERDGEPRHDTVTHLRAYAIKDAKGSAPRILSAPLRIVNPLGTFAVQVKGPDSLLEPARKQLDTPAPLLGPNTVDRYQCYKAKILTKRCSGDPTRACKADAACGVDGPCLGKFPKGTQVTLADQFTPGKRFDLVKPTRFCTPALANSDPVQSPDGHLLCFKVKLGAGATKHTPRVGVVHTTTALARERLDTIAEDEVCVPSLSL